MSAQHEASDAFLATLKLCDVALEALKSDVSAEHQDAHLQTLLSDYNTLLTRIYNSTTKLALALKNDKPAYSASVPVLEGLRSEIDSFASCVCCVDPGQYGKTLTQEMRWRAEEVIDALKSLLLELSVAGSKPSLGGKQDYGKTGAVHEIIDRARGIPSSNLEAVRSRWQANTEALQDAFKELSEMVDDAKAENDDPGLQASDDFGDEDGWDELGFGPKSERPKPSEEELNRMVTVHRTMKLGHALHKRVAIVLLIPPDSSVSLTNRNLTAPVLDDGIVRSKSLVSAADELVSALETPQDLTSLSESLSMYHSAAEGIRRYLLPFQLVTPGDLDHCASGESMGGLRGLGAQLAGLTLAVNAPIEDSNDSVKLSNDRKWFDACFTQLYKSLDTVIQAGES